MNSTSIGRRGPAGMLVLLTLLTIVLGFVFKDTFRSGQVLFANDGPLGQLVTASIKMPDAFGGMWTDINWLGADGGRAAIGLTYPLLWLLGPVGFAKFFVPCALIILGLSAGYFFKRLEFKPAVCVLGGLAAALNSNFFSNACWGLSTRALSLAAIFLSLAALQAGLNSGSALRSLVLAVLAGLGIGLSIAEGGDNGAIFAIFVGAFAFYQYLFTVGPVGLRVIKGAGRVAIMVVFSALLAAQTLNVFVNTAVKGIVGIQTDTMSPEQKWGWATQWSLPPVETLRVVVPGLFGYRLDTPEGGNYWGGVGRDLAFDKTGQGSPRHSGAGEYAGVLVALAAAWAFFNSLRKTDSAFSATEKKMIWFWSGALLVAVLLSWGYHAPFYQFVYKLPFFSTIRNPMKFMHPGHLCLMILFAYGLQGMWRRYLGAVAAKAEGFEKKWLLGSLAAVGAGLAGLMAYTAASGKVAAHLNKEGFTGTPGQKMLQHSTHEVMLAVFFLAVSVVAVLLIQKGVFSGAKAKWAGVLLGIILVVDLARANAPWIKYYNYRERYASNPVLEILAHKPYEHRVALPPFQVGGQFGLLSQYYHGEWLQHQFPFYNVQSLDQPQEPRMPAEKAAYRTALATNLVRLWELTNTRFLCGMAGGFADALNQQLDPVKRRFREHTAFNLPPKPGVGQPTTLEDFEVVLAPGGPLALVEFTGALPRAKLFSTWEVNTNAPATLARLADAAFDPQQSVLVMDEIPAPAANAAAAPKLSAEIVSYAPKKIEVRTESSGPALLLLNNKWDEGWKATVDGRPATLLRCNFLMQGVQLPANSKSVVFRYEPKSTIFYVSLAAMLLGVALCGLLAVFRANPGETSAPAPAPAAPASPESVSRNRGGKSKNPKS